MFGFLKKQEPAAKDVAAESTVSETGSWFTRLNGLDPKNPFRADSGLGCTDSTHGTAPKYANKDVVNPGSVVLSGEMMLRHLGWTEAADTIIAAMEKSILQKRVTYDFARLMEGAKEVKCSEFADAVIGKM